MAIAVDFGTDLVMAIAAWIGLWLVRHGRFRMAIGQFLIMTLLSGCLAYSTFGYQATDGNLTFVMLLALSGLMLGRRALWITYAAEALILLISVSPFPAEHVQRAVSHVQGAYDIIPFRALISFLLITVILDRCIYALRESLAEAHRQRGQLSVEMAYRESMQDQLIRAQRMDAIGEFASGIAHDISNVFSIILGFSVERDRLEDAAELNRSDIDAVINAMDGIELAARRGSSISKKVLGLSRTDVLAAEVFDVSQVLRELHPILRKVLPLSVNLSISAAEAATPVIFDRGELELAIINLVTNARDAMPNGGTCTITASVRGQFVALAVGDTGMGMSEETRTRVFEPFFTTKRKGDGTGLGLSIVDNLVQRAGGHMTVDSTPGTGSTFQINIPVWAGNSASSASVAA